MGHRTNRSENQRGKGAEAVPEAETAMGRFKSLARRLLYVSRDELREEQQRRELEKAKERN